MSKKLFFLFAAIFPVLVQAQNYKDFKSLPSGLRYKSIEDKKAAKSKVGNMVKLFITYTTEKDSVVFSSKMIGEAAELQITAPQFKGDPMEGFAMMGAGDSMLFLVSSDSMFKSGNGRPGYATVGSYLKLGVRMVSSMTMDESNKLKQLEAAGQIDKDDKIIQQYIKDKGLKAEKTPSGLYRVVEKQGDGAKVEAGKKVTVNYTGKLVDGTPFDSSLNPGREPFEFTIGQHQVIAGWDEGIALFNVGGKGSLLIPSALGYGARGAGGVIGPNAVLIFDIEVLKVE